MSTYNPSEVVKAMCSSILEEAEARESEINENAIQTAEQNYDKVISSTQETLQLEAQRQEDEIKKNFQIQNAKITNAAKLEILKAQKKALNEALEEAKKRLNEFSKGPEYPEVLTKLIAEGLIELHEKKVRLTVRKADQEICKQCVPNAIQLAQKKFPDYNPKIIIEEERYLPAEPHCAGGVIFTCNKGKIRLSNILNERLRLAYDGVLPQIRKLVLKEQ